MPRWCPGKPVHAPASTEIDSVITEYYYTATGNRETKMTPAGLEASYTSNYENMISQITANGVQTDFYYDAEIKGSKYDVLAPLKNYCLAMFID